MAIQIADQFSYSGVKPLDARFQYATVADMKAAAEASLYDGCFAYVKATKKYYSFDSNNTVDTTTGRWRDYSSGGGSSYTAGSGIDITSNVISTEKSESGDIDEIVDIYPTAGALVSIVNAFNRSDLYSTSEKMIGQYIDGKPLYQKVIDFGALPNTSEKSVAHNISNIENVIEIYGTSRRSSDTNKITMDLSQVTTAIQCRNTSVYVSTDDDRTAWDITKIIVKYTKSTDVATVIGTDTEYSTDEKIVGTWIDSSPIFQKTIDYGTLPNNTTSQKAHGISNLAQIIDYESVIYRTDSNVWYPNPRVNSSGGYTPTVNFFNGQIDITFDTSNIYITTGMDRTNCKAYVTLKYIKATS